MYTVPQILLLYCLKCTESQMCVLEPLRTLNLLMKGLLGSNLLQLAQTVRALGQTIRRSGQSVRTLGQTVGYLLVFQRLTL